jgi:hypothetical protein
MKKIKKYHKTRTKYKSLILFAAKCRGVPPYELVALTGRWCPIRAGTFDDIFL